MFRRLHLSGHERVAATRAEASQAEAASTAVRVAMRQKLGKGARTNQIIASSHMKACTQAQGSNIIDCVSRYMHASNLMELSVHA